MFFEKIKFLFFTKEGIGGLLQTFLILFGFIWLLIEPTSVLLPDKTKSFFESNGLFVFLFALTISFIGSLIYRFPRLMIKKQFKSSNTTICIKVGDVFDQEGNVAIASNDFFDTSINPASGKSLKSQLIRRYYNGEPKPFYEKIKTSLEKRDVKGSEESEKNFGNKIRYPVGTVAIVDVVDKRFFVTVLTTLTYQGENKEIFSNKDHVWSSLNGLWKEVRKYGRLNNTSIPVWGSGYSMTNVSHKILIQLIVLSYALNSRESTITKRLSVVVHKNDYDPKDFFELEAFLNSIEI